MDATYQYDALTRQIVTESAAETRHFYFNSQWRAIEERVSGAVKAQYVWNPADRWDLIRRKRSVAGTLDEIRFVLRDYLDPAAIINESGTVTERYRYDAFGPVTVLAPDFSVRATSECGWNFLYHAEFIDALTGLYNYGYRYYHPGLGRWTSRDPIGERGGLNLFAFVGNDGVNSVDLLGEWGLPAPSRYIPHPDPSRRYYRNKDGVIIKRHVREINPWFGERYIDHDDVWERPAGSLDPVIINDEGKPVDSPRSIEVGQALINQFDGMTQEAGIQVTVAAWAAMAAAIYIPVAASEAEVLLVANNFLKRLLREAKCIRCRKPEIHKPHHAFIIPTITKSPPFFRVRRCWMSHVQLNCWIQGKKGSQFEIQLPFGPCYKNANAEGGLTH